MRLAASQVAPHCPWVADEEKWAKSAIGLIWRAGTLPLTRLHTKLTCGLRARTGGVVPELGVSAAALLAAAVGAAHVLARVRHRPVLLLRGADARVACVAVVRRHHPVV